MFSEQCLSYPFPYIIHKFPIDNGIWTGKIDIFKNTVGIVLRPDHLFALEASVPENYHFARNYIAYQLPTQNIYCRALGSNDKTIVYLSEAERLHTKGVPHHNELIIH